MLNTEDKFQEIYEKYKNLVMKVAFDMTGYFHIAQDICQETFLKLYGYQNDLDESRVKSWLMVVAANLIRDRFRKNSRRKEVLDEFQEIADSGEEVNCIDAYLDQLDRRDLKHRMLEGLRKKNPNWYEVFILVEYLDVPRKVIAKQRGIALSTVDSYLKKSMKWLKEHYQKEYDEL